MSGTKTRIERRDRDRQRALEEQEKAGRGGQCRPTGTGGAEAAWRAARSVRVRKLGVNVSFKPEGECVRSEGAQLKISVRVAV